MGQTGARDVLLAATAVFWPELVEHEGFVFLREGFSVENLEVWKASDFYAETGMRGVAAAINHRHVTDVFPEATASLSEDEITALGHVLGRCVTARLEEAYPDLRFEFETGEEIWFWQDGPAVQAPPAGHG